MFSVDFYRTEDGKVPVEEFLDSLNVKMRNKALNLLLFSGWQQNNSYEWVC